MPARRVRYFLLSGSVEGVEFLIEQSKADHDNYNKEKRFAETALKFQAKILLKKLEKEGRCSGDKRSAPPSLGVLEQGN